MKDYVTVLFRAINGETVHPWRVFTVRDTRHEADEIVNEQMAKDTQANQTYQYRIVERKP